ncbi:hypothetical protein E4T39_05221 [Aureobasidium subglaciale]|nr:hypothetical protein E4T39_05221 [Aureobasidium subglaciale]
MPARLPQAAGLSKCPSCTARSFSLSTRQLALGPESPRYMDIPQPPQQTLPDKTRLKGILPVPRDVFAGQNPKDPLNLHQATKEPAQKLSHNDPRSIWKERMAASRRKNLNEGLQALQSRRLKSDHHRATRAAIRQQEREARLHQPEREDDRLTAPSVDNNLLALLKKGPLPDPNRDARLADMRQREATKQAARQEDRRDALHSLYVNARDFIVTDAQLATAIDKAFGTVTQPRAFGSNSASIWDVGPPSSTVDMLNSATAKGVRGGALSQSSVNRDQVLTAARVRRIAAELTGGQLPSKS